MSNAGRVKQKQKQDKHEQEEETLEKKTDIRNKKCREVTFPFNSNLHETCVQGNGLRQGAQL